MLSARFVLLNGRRFVPGGVAPTHRSTWNTIPIEAIDRVEVFKDGALVTYGSDAIAGVVNIITKRDFGRRGKLIHWRNEGRRTHLQPRRDGGETSEKGTLPLLPIPSSKRSSWAAEVQPDRVLLRFRRSKAHRSGWQHVPEGYIADSDLDSGNAAWQAVQGAAGEGNPLFNDPVTGWRAFNFDGNSDAGDQDPANYAPGEPPHDPKPTHELLRRGPIRF